MQQNHSLSINAVNWVRLLSSLAIILGICVLCGWIWNIEVLKSVLPHLVTLKVNAAVGFLLGGLVLFLQTYPNCNRVMLGVRWTGIALVLLLGGLTLSECLFNWNVGIDLLLFRSPAHEILTPFPGRMSLLAAACFVLLGGALLFTELKRFWYFVQSLAVVVIIIALLPLGGYLFGDMTFPDIDTPPSQMAIHAALGFLLLGVSILILTSEVGLSSRLRKTLPILGIVAASGLLLLTGSAAFYGLEQNKIAIHEVENTYDVNLHLESANSIMREYNFNMRAFLLNHDKDYESRAAQAQNRLLSELDSVRQQASDIPTQQRLIALFANLKLRFQVDEQRLKIQADAGQNSLENSNSGQLEDQFTAEIIRQIQEIKAKKMSLLRVQQQTLEIRNTTSYLAVGFSITFSILLLFGTIRALQQEIIHYIFSEKRLRESESRVRALFNTSAIGIVVFSEHCLIEEFNPASAAIFQFSEPEVIGQHVNKLIPELCYCEEEHCLKNLDKIINIEQTFIGKRSDTTTFPMELNVGEAKLNGSRIFVAFIQDISQRRQHENDSRQFEAMVQSSDDAIMSKNLEGLVTTWNASAERMYGYSPDEMMGSPMKKLLLTEQTEEASHILEKIAQGQRINNFETVQVRKDGTLIDVSVTLSPIFDEFGTVIGVSKIARDISQSKQLERQLVAAKQAAEAATLSKSTFLANMSHEIRTPMNAVIGLTRLALETQLSPKQLDYLQKIQSSSQALLGILNDILDLSKIESGRLEIERIEFNPTLMLQNVSDLFMAKAEEKGLDIFLNIAPEIPETILSDPLRIQQILSNLVSNAIKFTPQGEIHIRMELEASSGNELILRLSVVDGGIGISEEGIKRLFQPFSQADASITRKFGGTGLGLVISKQLVELLGGTISVSSELGQGSTFSFTLSCGKGQPYNWDLDSQNIKNIRVLVVDDQETSRTILKNILESWSLQVTTALSATDALQKIHLAEQTGIAFDLLVSDWQMEGMNGLDLVRELKQQKNPQHLSIIMVTAHRKELLLKEAEQTVTHPDAILTKPVIPSSLLNTILHVFHYQGKEAKSLEAHQNPYEAARPIRNAHILLVEDNELNQQVAGEFLQKAGLRVSIANHGGEAVLWVQQITFDVVLMDLQMPVMDGFEATQHIRELPGCGNLPIIAMTAAAMHDDRKACVAVGMNDFVAKPINPQELIDTLLRWIKPTVDLLITLPTAPSKRDTNFDLAESLPGFDLKNIMIMLNGDEQQLITLLNAFREQFINEYPVFIDKLGAGDREFTKKWLHTLKGTAGNLGARTLHHACELLEAELIQGNYESTTFNHWRETFDSTLHSLAALERRHYPAIFPADTVETAQQIIDELEELLANDSYISNKLLTRLKNVLPDTHQDKYQTLNQHIFDTHYAKARHVLETLRTDRNLQ